MKKNKLEFEIIESFSVVRCIKTLVKKKLRPATIQEVWKLSKERKIPKKFYDTGTLWYKGDFSQVTLEQLKNIEQIYADVGRLLFLDNDYMGFGGVSDLNYSGRFVGIRDRREIKQKGVIQR